MEFGMDLPASHDERGPSWVICRLLINKVGRAFRATSPTPTTPASSFKGGEPSPPRWSLTRHSVRHDGLQPTGGTSNITTPPRPRALPRPSPAPRFAPR